MPYRRSVFGALLVMFSGCGQKMRLPLLDVLLTWQLRQERWGNRNIRFSVPSKRLLPSNRPDYT